MVHVEEDRGKLQVTVSQRFLLALQITILTSVVGAVAYPIINAGTAKARHDPFTGTDGALLRRDIEQVRQDFEDFVDDFEYYKAHHHDFALESVKDTERRMATMEEKMNRIERQRQ